MKKCIVVVIFLFVIAPLVFAANSQSKFYWDAPLTNTDGSLLTDLAGYKLHCGSQIGVYTVHKDVGNVSVYPVTDVVGNGTYYCVVTAYDTSGNESGYSNEINFTLDLVVPNPPGQFRVQ